MRRLMWIHPLLFAWLAPAALLSHNIESAPPYTAIRAILAAAGLSLLLLLVFRALALAWTEAAFLTSMVMMASSVFGNILQLIGARPGGPGSIRFHLISLLVFSGFVGACLWWTRKTHALSPPVHVFLALVGAVMIGTYTVRITAYERLAQIPLSLPAMSAELERYRPTSPPAQTPDIYYVIVDGYGRDDVLREIYRPDNAEFVQTLKLRGFFVASAGRSNYAQTSLSLASSMNMSYLDELQGLKDIGLSQSYVTRLFRHNEVMDVLRSYGYAVISIPVTYNRTLLPTADVTYEYSAGPVNSFESLVLENSIFWSPFILARGADPSLPFPGYASRRESILANQAALEDTILMSGPKFVFAHLAVPHPPFVFTRTGGPTDAPYPYREQDGDQFQGSPQEYLTGYREQVLFADQLVIAFLDRLEAQGDAGDIVILQGDHGPGSGLDWLDPARTDMWERLAILNAIRVPGLDDESFEDTASPVNTFRILFNYLFDASYPRLADKSYFSSWTSPYSFLSVPESDLRRR